MIFTKVTEDLWNEIHQLQKEAFQEELYEELEVLISKWQRSPESCFVLNSSSNNVSAYLISHKWDALTPPVLNKTLPTVSPSGPILYLHDLVVSHQVKGQGIGSMMVKHLLKIANIKGYEKILLVAVQGADRFWSRQGFIEMKGEYDCNSYGSDAKLMFMNL